jgi:hypothetical protein
MDLILSPEEKQFRGEFGAWLEAGIPRDWPEWRVKPTEVSFPLLRAWQRKLYEGASAADSYLMKWDRKSES